MVCCSQQSRTRSLNAIRLVLLPGLRFKSLPPSLLNLTSVLRSAGTQAATTVRSQRVGQPPALRLDEISAVLGRGPQPGDRESILRGGLRAETAYCTILCCSGGRCSHQNHKFGRSHQYCDVVSPEVAFDFPRGKHKTPPAALGKPSQCFLSTRPLPGSGCPTPSPRSRSGKT